MPQMQRADPAPPGCTTTVINRVRCRPRTSLPDEDVYQKGEACYCMPSTPHPEKARTVVRSPASIPEMRTHEPCWTSQLWQQQRKGRAHIRHAVQQLQPLRLQASVDEAIQHQGHLLGAVSQLLSAHHNGALCNHGGCNVPQYAKTAEMQWRRPESPKVRCNGHV